MQKRYTIIVEVGKHCPEHSKNFAARCTNEHPLHIRYLKLDTVLELGNGELTANRSKYISSRPPFEVNSEFWPLNFEAPNTKVNLPCARRPKRIQMKCLANPIRMSFEERCPHLYWGVPFLRSLRPTRLGDKMAGGGYGCIYEKLSPSNFKSDRISSLPVAVWPSYCSVGSLLKIREPYLRNLAVNMSATWSLVGMESTWGDGHDLACVELDGCTDMHGVGLGWSWMVHVEDGWIELGI